MNYRISRAVKMIRSVRRTLEASKDLIEGEFNSILPLFDHFVRSRQHVGRNRITILDFRFRILACPVIGLVCRL